MSSYLVKSLGLGRLTSGVLLCALGLGGTSLSAQVTGQSSQEIALPDTQERRSDPINIKVEQNLAASSECPFEANDVKVSIDALSFVGAGGSAVPPQISEVLSTISAPGAERPLAVVCQLRDEANATLRKGGWIASVSLPPQEIDGTLRLAVTSGLLGNIAIEGDPGPYADLMQGLVGRLKQINPLNERAIERALLNAIDVPGLSAGLKLAPSASGAGQIDGTLTVNFDRYAVYFNARNMNARAVGRETVFGRAELYGLTGLSDSTYIGAQTTVDFEEQFVLQAGHEFGVGPDNIRIGTEVTYAESRPDILGLDLQTDTFVAGLYASYPAIRTPLAALDLVVGFELVDQSTDIAAVRLSEDATRNIYVRAQMDGQRRRIDRSTEFLYRGFVELSQGISAFGATDAGASGFAETNGFVASRPFGDATATVVRAGGDLTWLASPVISLRAKVEGQWTNDPLLSFEEFAIGNLGIGRGYDPGASSGDRALGAQYELGANVWSSNGNRLQLFGFYDAILVENLDPGTLDRTRRLSSTGGGFRLNLGRKLSAEVSYAAPLDPALPGDIDEPPSRLLFSITTQLPALTR